MKCLFLFLVTASYGYRTYIKPNIKLNWQNASEYCINTYGTSLATISNEIESVQAEGACLASNYDPIGCWIGFNDISQTGQWTWISGAIVTFTDWGNRLPDNHQNNEYCAHIWSERFFWNDIDCPRFLYFLCDAPTNSPTIATQIPSINPTNTPSNTPTNYPSTIPTYNPSNNPSKSPTMTTEEPSHIPSMSPTINPTKSPSMSPSNIPSIPTINPTSISQSPSKVPLVTSVTLVAPIVNNITILIPVGNNSSPHLINTQMFIILFGLVGFLILIVLCLMVFILKQNKQLKRDSNIIVNSYTSNTEMHNNNNATDLKNTDDTNIQDTVSQYNNKEGILDLKSNKSSDIESLFYNPSPVKAGTAKQKSRKSSDISDIHDDSDALAMKGEPQIQSNVSSNISDLYNVSYNVITNGNIPTKRSKNKNGYV